MNSEGQPQPDIPDRRLLVRLKKAVHLVGWTLAVANWGIGSQGLVSGEMALEDNQDAIHASSDALRQLEEQVDEGRLPPDDPRFAANRARIQEAVTAIPQYQQQALVGKVGIGTSVLMSSALLGVVLLEDKRQKQKSPEHEDIPSGMPFMDFLEHLNDESGTLTDTELLRRVPDTYSEIGQKIRRTLPEAGSSGVVYTQDDHIRWEILRPGDVFRGTFRLYGVSTMTQLLEGPGDGFVLLSANRSDCERDDSAPAMHIRMPRQEFINNIDAFRKLTACGLTMDMRINASSIDAMGQVTHPVVAVPLRVVSMEQPFQPEQLRYAGKDGDYLLTGTVRSISIREGATWLDIEASDGTIRQVRSEGNVSYLETVDGQPYPAPRVGDGVHIIAGLDLTHAPKDGHTLFKHIAAYRINSGPDGEATDVEYYNRANDLLRDVSKMETIDSYDAFKALAGELMLLNAHWAVKPLVSKYKEVFFSIRDAPIALENWMQIGSLKLLNDAFPAAQVAAMAKSQFKEFTLAAAYGQQVPQPEAVGLAIVARELFATRDYNPELVNHCLGELLPAVAEGKLQLQPFQVEILKQAIGYAVKAFPHVIAARAIASVTESYLRVREGKDETAKRTFDALAGSLKAALVAGIKACQPTQKTDRDSADAIATYQLAHDNLHLFNKRHGNADSNG